MSLVALLGTTGAAALDSEKTGITQTNVNTASENCVSRPKDAKIGR